MTYLNIYIYILACIWKGGGRIKGERRPTECVTSASMSLLFCDRKLRMQILSFHDFLLSLSQQ